MKATLPFILCLLVLPLFTVAQINKGTFHFGLEGGIANFTATTNYNTEELNVAIPYSQFTAEVGIQDRIALGLSFRGYQLNSGTTTDSISTEVTTIKNGALYFTSNYYLINKEHFNLYVGIGLGGAALSVDVAETIDSSGIETGDYVEFRAISVQLNAGINRYFGKKKRLGLRLGLHYTSSPFQAYYYETSLNGEDTEQQELNGRAVDQTLFLFRGAELSFGLAFKIGG